MNSTTDKCCKYPEGNVLKIIRNAFNVEKRVVYILFDIRCCD